MGDFSKGSRLASVLPSTTAETLLFTAIMDTEAIRLFICNVSAGDVLIRWWHVPAGGVVEDKYALIFDVLFGVGTILDLESFFAGSGVQMKEGDELWVQTDVANSVAFNLYGVTANIIGQ